MGEKRCSDCQRVVDISCSGGQCYSESRFVPRRATPTDAAKELRAQIVKYRHGNVVCETECNVDIHKRTYAGRVGACDTILAMLDTIATAPATEGEGQCLCSTCEHRYHGCHIQYTPGCTEYDVAGVEWA